MALNSTAGDASAESYFSIAEADAYFTARGVAAWTGSDASKEQAARLGTTYLDNQYRGKWKGYRTNETQALAWPRIGEGGDSRFRLPGQSFAVYGVVDLDGFEIATDAVPVQVKRAAMESALMALGGTVLEPTLTRGGRIKSQTKTVGPLSKSTTWEDGAPAVDRYTVIDGLLRGLVTGAPGATSGNVPLVRA